MGLALDVAAGIVIGVIALIVIFLLFISAIAIVSSLSRGMKFFLGVAILFAIVFLFGWADDHHLIPH